MKKVGLVLAEERKRQRITLEQVAQATHIRHEFLEAIERNDFSVLPAAPFVRGFLQTYSKYLSLDSKTVLALLRRDFKVGEKGQVLPREYMRPVSRKKQWLNPQLTTVAGVVFVIGIVFSYIGWQFVKLRQPPPLEVISPVQDGVVEKNVFVSGKTTTDAVVFVDSKPVSIAPDGTFETDVFFVENGNYTITIQAEDRNKRATTIQRSIRVEE